MHARAFTSGAVVGVALGAVTGAALTQGSGAAGAGREAAPTAVRASPEPGTREEELVIALAREKARADALASRLADLERMPRRMALGGPGVPGGDVTMAAGPGAASMSRGPGAPTTASATAAPSADRFEELLRSTDWDAAGKAYVTLARARREGGRGLRMPDPSARLELNRLELALAELSRAMGASDPEAALDDPRVREALLAARLRAAGGGALDDRQRETLRAEIARLRAHLAARPSDAAPLTIAERALRSVRDDLAIEEGLPAILTAEQYAAWLATVGDDPFAGKPWPRMVMGIAGDEGADPGRELSREWAERFQVAEGGRRALEEIARRFADGMMSIAPLATALDGRERRLAALRRAAAVLTVQVSCEHELSSEPTFTAEERARMRDGLGGLFEVLREPIHGGD